MTHNQFWTKFTNLLLWYAGVNFCIASTLYLATRLAEIPITMHLYRTIYAILCCNVMLPLFAFGIIRSLQTEEQET